MGGRTLVEGASFAVCGLGGDINGDGPEGLFVRDVRVLSLWCLKIDGHRPEPLSGFTEQPFLGVFVSRAPVREGRVEPTLLVERRRYVGGGMREDIVIHNHGPEAAGISVTLEVACDLADLFEVKLGHTAGERPVKVETKPEEWTATGRHANRERSVSVYAPGAVVSADTIAYRVVVPPHSTWQTSLEVSTGVDGAAAAPRFRIGAPIERAAPVARIEEWRRNSSTFEVESAVLSATLARTETDLAALRISDPATPDLSAVAAGAPWFMALFGRDALLTSSMTLSVNPDLAVGTLRALALHQGQRVDPMTEEQPGRIVHELRLGLDSVLAPGGADGYYGSVDATPLFVVVLGQLSRWGADRGIIEELLPAADRALEWITRYGDRDGDGFVEYERSTDRGLRNQGWKDSLDGINFADGTLAEPPIALVEVQAYVYAAYRARSDLAAQHNDPDASRHWSEQADTMRRRINEAFWIPDGGYYAVGLDGDKRPIDALTSNMGHVLWAGAADADKAALVADRLLSPEIFSGYGIRTLATSMGAYNPVSYHNGSVWPHDTALAVAGLVRYGHWDHARRVATGMIDAAAYFSGRLPELFCGFDKNQYRGPVPYPTSCSPQAWASAAPVAVVAAILGLDPNVPAGIIQVDPHVPPEWGNLTMTDIAVGPERMSVHVARDGTWSVAGAQSVRLVPPPPDAVI
ncbi:MAG: amylo-alpha-1,6-glucosidase [Acidobacteriota bacterium]|nr:amylo-alpha-1,6-glucosidase [Acidobacteriota bacterium]